MTSSIPAPSWAYSHDVTFSNPVFSHHTIKNANKSEVALAPENFRPNGGFTTATTKFLPNSNSSNDTKIIYTVRHGNTPHNDDSNAWGRPVAWRYLSQLRKNFDPQLTPEGARDARAAGEMLLQEMKMMAATGGCGSVDEEEATAAPRPVTVYSSPLRRCVETAMYMIKHAGLDRPGGGGAGGCGGPVTLRVKEGLREWMGYRHGHQSDRRGSRESIRALVEQLKTGLGVEVRYTLDVPEQDQFHDEVYVDVDRRVRGVLDDIFSDEGGSSGACVMLVLHNRCNKSLLRVLGHAPASVEDFEVANCAMLSYRVSRRQLDDHEVGARLAYEDVQWREDQKQSENNRRERLRRAVEDARAWNNDESSKHRVDDLRKFLQYHAEQRNDPAASEALESLENDLILLPN
ncbi:hypothetical protein N8I77_011257 [Diaporthe amygdali]|uniref:Uncharacterized protein n=1 Tax=Phomopsis amygdali TaxID=1214568 RepID=A0AAD9S5Z1_PHOAM|nr:hypothetical protein N8I77_011257 [Diaporthe amygdali]